MNDRDTTVLKARLTLLADDLAPPLDVVGQVRDARARHSKQRRGRIAVLAVATATAAVVVGTSTAVELLSSTPQGGEVAVPTRTAPATTEAAPTTPPPTETTGLPAGWEPRSFQGVTFAVPPGARMADYVMAEPPADAEPFPTFIWNGFSLGGGEYAHVKVVILGDETSFSAPAGYDRVTVKGAREAYVAIEPTSFGDPSDPTYRIDATGMGLEIVAPGGRVHVDAEFPAGQEGEQMIRDLIASFDLTGMEPSGTVPASATVPTGWESRSFDGVTFAVPPGARAADEIGEEPPERGGFPRFVWNGPNLGDPRAYAYVKILILPPVDGEVGQPEGFESIGVPGAQQAYAGFGSGFHWGPAEADDRFYVTRGSAAVYTADRMIAIEFDFAQGPAGEQMARDLVASLAVS